MSIEKFSEIKEEENILEKEVLEDSQLPEMQEWESLEEGIQESLKLEDIAEEEDVVMWNSFKTCATRHGCTGATNCNSCMTGPEGH